MIKIFGYQLCVTDILASAISLSSIEFMKSLPLPSLSPHPTLEGFKLHQRRGRDEGAAAPRGPLLTADAWSIEFPPAHLPRHLSLITEDTTRNAWARHSLISSTRLAPMLPPGLSPIPLLSRCYEPPYFDRPPSPPFGASSRIRMSGWRCGIV